LDVGTKELLLSAHEETTLAAARPGAFAMSGDRLDTGLGEETQEINKLLEILTPDVSNEGR
jgi:hypothetical protein